MQRGLKDGQADDKNNKFLFDCSFILSAYILHVVFYVEVERDGANY